MFLNGGNYWVTKKRIFRPLPPLLWNMVFYVHHLCVFSAVKHTVVINNWGIEVKVKLNLNRNCGKKSRTIPKKVRIVRVMYKRVLLDALSNTSYLTLPRVRIYSNAYYYVFYLILESITEGRVHGFENYMYSSRTNQKYNNESQYACQYARIKHFSTSLWHMYISASPV
jgi:hypothetical protein